MSEIDRAELRRRRDDAWSETCRKRYTAAEAKSLALELADDVDALLDALDEAEGLAARTRDAYHAVLARAEAAEAMLERIREAVGGHPECEAYDDDDPISCGWKLAYASVVAALAPVTEEGDGE